MEEKEIIIVGQGLAGTWLSWWLQVAGITYKVIDLPDPGGASRRAAGLINPVTGRRMVKTWMIDELMPFASQAYRQIGGFLKQEFIREISVLDFFPSPQMLLSFEKRMNEESDYLFKGLNPEEFSPWFNYDFGWGGIKPCLLVHVEKLLDDWRAWLKQSGHLIETGFELSQLKLKSDELVYSDIRSRYIIYCDGVKSSENPYFEKLPFALNKGEGLLVEIKNLPEGKVFKKGMSLVPYRENIYWLGSSYEWEFEDGNPSDKFRQNAESWLKHFIKLPFTILEHFAAIRPATLERRPFVGFHPNQPQVGILNGMGTKGCSLAPYFAWQLVNKISGKGEIDPLADISRFTRILKN